MYESNPLWSQIDLPQFPLIPSGSQFDVVVVGAGITGLTAGYLLSCSGLRVAVLERDRLGSGDTNYTTAHLTAVTDVRISKLVTNFGEAAARLVWQAGMSAIATIEAIARPDHCEFQRLSGYLLASLDSHDDERDQLAEDAEWIAKLGGTAELLDRVPYFDRPGVYVADQAKFHPRKYLRLLATAIATDSRSAIYEQSEVTEIADDPPVVTVNDKFKIACQHVIVATHVPLMGKAGVLSATTLQSKLAPYTSYVIGATVDKGVVPHSLYWDTSDPYYYLRVDSHTEGDYLIFGGCDHKTGQVDDTEERFARLADKLRQLVPQARIDRRWSGQVIETNDGLPYIGETAPRQFAATGFAGNGMTFGTLGAMMACDYVLGRDNPWSELFSINRKNLRAGAWNYVRENMDYPYYLLRDRFTPAEGNSTDAVKPGEGKLLQLNGKRVACYRDAEGSLNVVSAVCTHMGCFVRWNEAEETWDCPCHGSRFRPNGEVIAGPAESPLSPVEVDEANVALHRH
jgi:glycine/D-amino acid oxidase-like deaminating enzyme/nitrite reductase/ring-hydroxylating ferredoxin subunit